MNAPRIRPCLRTFGCNRLIDLLKRLGVSLFLLHFENSFVNLFIWSYKIISFINGLKRLPIGQPFV